MSSPGSPNLSSEAEHSSSNNAHPHPSQPSQHLPNIDSSADEASPILSLERGCSAGRNYQTTSRSSSYLRPQKKPSSHFSPRNRSRLGQVDGGDDGEDEGDKEDEDETGINPHSGPSGGERGGDDPLATEAQGVQGQSSNTRLGPNDLERAVPGAGRSGHPSPSILSSSLKSRGSLDRLGTSPSQRGNRISIEAAEPPSAARRRSTVVAKKASKNSVSGRRGSKANGAEADEMGEEANQGEDSFAWLRSVLDKYGAVELDNKGSVARDHLALERTFLAWLRTSIAFASIGIAITQLFRLNTTIASDPSNPSSPVDATSSLRRMGKPLGATFLGVSILILAIGWRRYFEAQYWIIRGKFPASRGSVFLVTAVAFALTVASLVVVVVGGGGAVE